MTQGANPGIICSHARLQGHSVDTRTTSVPDLALQGHQSRGPAGPGFVGLAKSRSPSGPGSVGLGKKRDPRAKGQGWPWVCNGQIDKKGKFSL